MSAFEVETHEVIGVVEDIRAFGLDLYSGRPSIWIRDKSVRLISQAGSRIARPNAGGRGN